MTYCPCLIAMLVLLTLLCEDGYSLNQHRLHLCGGGSCSGNYPGWRICGPADLIAFGWSVDKVRVQASTMLPSVAVTL